jgi:hypothetical protein
VSKGFLIFAENSTSVDYLRQAYALALTIKYSQQSVKNVSLVTNDLVPEKYKDIFDEIIPIPWIDSTNLKSDLKAEHRWKLYHITPYDETIVLDSDMLLLEDISVWWDYCSNYDIKFCSKIYNYKLESIDVDTAHRATFIANNLTSPYFALHYFKKSDRAHEFYKVLEFVINNWEFARGTFAPNEPQLWISMDLASAIVIEIMLAYECVDDVISPLGFIHMKTPLQGWSPIPARWQDTVPFSLNSKGDLFVGNIKQRKLFHYVEKNFITDNILAKLEKISNGS